MIKIIKDFLYAVGLVAILSLPYLVFADNSPGMIDGINKVTENSYQPVSPDGSALATLASIVSFFLSILGIVFLIYILYAGYHWMTAGGDSGKVTKAKDTIYRAVIGLIIIIGSYAISEFVFNSLLGIS